MKLYEINETLTQAMENLEAIYALKNVLKKDDNGNVIDADGNVIANPEATINELVEAWKNTIDGINEEFEQKAGDIAAYIKNLKSDAEQLKKEEQALKSRREAKENAAKHIQEYLLEEMRKANKLKIDTPQALISIRNNAESVSIEDESKFIEWAKEHNDELLKYKEPEISKTAIKAALKAGKEIPFAELKKTQSVIIK